MDQKILFIITLALTGIADGFPLNNSAGPSSARSRSMRRNPTDNSFGHNRNGVSSSSGPNHGQQSGQSGPSKSIRTTVNISNIPLNPGETKVIQHTLTISKPARKGSSSRSRTQNNLPPSEIGNNVNNNGVRGAGNRLGSSNTPGIGQNFNNNGPRGASNHMGFGNTNFGMNNGGGLNGHGLTNGHNAGTNGLGNSHNSNGQGVGHNSNGFGNGHRSISNGNGHNSNDLGNGHILNGHGNGHNLNGFGNEVNSNGHNNGLNLNSHGIGQNTNTNNIHSPVQSQGHGSGGPGAGRRGFEIIFADLVAHSQHGVTPTATIGVHTHANSEQHTNIPSAVDIFSLPNELPTNNGANLNQHVGSPDAPAQRLFQVQLPNGQSGFYFINPINPVGNKIAPTAKSLTAAGGRIGTASASNSITVTKSFLGMEDVVTTAPPPAEEQEIEV